MKLVLLKDNLKQIEVNKTEAKILIVDDLPANLSMLSDFLRTKGFKILIAEDGYSAIEKAKYAQPDLILLDVMMPGINGFETCERLKADNETKNIPVIFMTALSDTPYTIKGFELGAVDYVTKPIIQEEVYMRVKIQLDYFRMQQALERKNSELDKFSQTVAYDLKNPLGQILNLTELLLTTNLDDIEERSQRFFNKIHRAGLKMNEIIDELLMLAYTNKEYIKVQPLDMGEIVSQAIQRTHCERHTSICDIQFSGEWMTAIGYAPWVEQVWVNFLSNGIKYGGNPPQLTLGSEKSGNYIKYWVHDNGAGLTTDQQSKLFTPFTRLNQNKSEGHGLGLSIVQNIVEKMGGHVGVNSVLDEGSTFYFTLPTDQLTQDPPQ